MGALVADIAAAFVLLVAGGCARAVVVPLFYYLREHQDWWGEDFVKAELRELQEHAVRAQDIKARFDQLKQEMYEEHAGTKNAGKVSVEEGCFARLVEQRKRVEPQADYIREAEQRGDEEEARRRLAQVIAGKVPLFVEDASGYLHVNEAWEKKNGKVPPVVWRGRRVDMSEDGGLMESNDVRISEVRLEGLEKVADRARLVLEIYRYHGEAYATPESLELLLRAVEELEGRM